MHTCNRYFFADLRHRPPHTFGKDSPGAHDEAAGQSRSRGLWRGSRREEGRAKATRDSIREPLSGEAATAFIAHHPQSNAALRKGRRVVPSEP